MSPFQKRVKDLSAEFLKSVSKVEKEVSPKGVHRLRTSIRRLETVFAYAQSSLSKKTLSKKQQSLVDDLVALRKRAGKVRDLDIQLGLVNSVANGSTAADRRSLAEALKSKREKQARRLNAALKKLEKSKSLARLEKITEEIGDAAANGEDSSVPLEKAQTELTALAASSVARQPLKPKRLHQLRISLKGIRYTAELASESPQQEQFLTALKSVQDAIGEWHDWQTLLKSTEKHFAGRVNCALLVEMRALFAARHSAATSAIAHLLAIQTPAVARKQPRSATSAQVTARRA
jgi:CHAD domain-containing protein